MRHTANFNSSNLESAKYDDDTRVLTIWFQNGAVYTYADVEPVVWHQLVTAPSAGKFFHQNIKNAYTASKII